MNEPKLSIVIATYNSAGFLPRIFSSLERQSLPRAEYEVILVDGGSKDTTYELGRNFGALIIDNPRTEPVHAKYLGFQAARGKCLMYLDHDEVLENEHALAQRVAALEQPGVRVVISSGYRAPPGSSIANLYINEFGDPFSFFIYRLSKDFRFFPATMRRRYGGIDAADRLVIDFPKDLVSLPLIEIAAGGSAVDLHWLRQHPELLTGGSQAIPHIFQRSVRLGAKLALLTGDIITHYSSETIRKFLVKIEWRIRNNVYHVETIGGAGFSGRVSEGNSGGRLRKYLFIPYALTVFPVVLDALHLAFTRRRIGYFAHVPLTLFTAWKILFHMGRKAIGLSAPETSYDGKAIVKR